jgi:hypothetical protein
MKCLLLILWIHIASLSISQQTNFFEPSDTFNKKRTIGLSIGVGSTAVGSLIGLGTIWYDDLGANGFKFRDDATQWYQMDKAGHAFTGYLIHNSIYQSYKWAGVKEKNSLLIGAATSAGYLLSFELLDGLSSAWGFSWTDISANTLGGFLFYTQQRWWNEQRIRMKFSSSPTSYAQYRPDVLGSNFAERLLKDYNGQTYWFSFNPYSFLTEGARFPTWINIAFGYSIDQRLFGSENSGSINYNGELLSFTSKRQYLFSLDIDLQRIPVKRPWLRSFFLGLNHLKIPFPAMEFSNTGIKFHGIYF